MNFTCDKCQRRYSIADDKVRGRTVKIRCKNCQNIVTVQGPTGEQRAGMMSIADVEKLHAKSPWETEATRAQPALDLSVEWFAMIQGKQTGPHTVRTLTERVGAGDVSLRTYLWRKGMADWKRAQDVPELSILFAGGNAAPSAPAPALARRKTTGAIPVALANGTSASHAPPPAPPKTGSWAAVVPSNGKSAQDSLAKLFLEDGAPDASTEKHQALGGTVEAEGSITIEPVGTGKRKKAPPAQEEVDPFAALNAVIDPAKLPPPGEATSFFIAQAGVHKRNPPWKIALFIASPIALVVAALYALSSLNVVPLQVTRVDDSGHEVKQSIFSSEGASGLKDLLLGRNKKPAVEKPVSVAVHAASPPRTSSPTTSSVGTVAKADIKGLSGADIRQFYGDQAKQDVGPKVRAGAAVEAKDTGGGLAQDQIQKVVSQSYAAFQLCVEQELKRNPNFKGGKVFLNATIASSGIVKHVELDREDVNRADVGVCIKDRAKRMVFPAFSGDEVEAQIPLFLTVTM